MISDFVFGVYRILQNGRRPILQLLHPNCSRYFSPDDLASLNMSIPSLSLKVNVEVEPIISVLVL